MRTILLVTAGVELGILVGFAFAEAHRFIRETRFMVLHALAAAAPRDTQ